MTGSVRESVLLVEGESDRAAVVALADARGLDLAAAGVEVLAMGGATNVARHLEELGPHGQGLRLAGLYDAAEERFVRRGLERAGFGPVEGRARLEALGFHSCHLDLEDELIRALGVDRVLEVVGAQGELESFRLLQRQPFQRDRPVGEQLRRFVGTASGRKVRYGRLLVEALEVDRVPRPLDAALADALRRPSGA